jgi:hypothetical protein
VLIGLLATILLFAGLAQTSSSDATETSIILLRGGGSWPIEVLEPNWCYCELENLLVPVVEGESRAAYFKWLLIVGFGIAAAM